jgi:hypothetical protein
MKLRSGRSADLRSLRWCGIKRLAGWGRIHANCSSGDARQDFSLLHLKWKNLFAEVQIGGQLDHERQTHKKPLFPTGLQNLMPYAPPSLTCVTRATAECRVLKGAWIQSSLDRTSLSLRKIIASLGFRASRTPVELATCEFQSTTATRGTGTPCPARRGKGRLTGRFTTTGIPPRSSYQSGCRTRVLATWLQLPGRPVAAVVGGANRTGKVVKRAEVKNPPPPPPPPPPAPANPPQRAPRPPTPTTHRPRVPRQPGCPSGPMQYIGGPSGTRSA